LFWAITDKSMSREQQYRADPDELMPMPDCMTQWTNGKNADAELTFFPGLLVYRRLHLLLMICSFY
jgi:hypothetical protein